MSKPEKKPSQGDGRVLRAEQNRHKVAQAMLELLRGGVIQPTREQVARQAALSLRTVYHHFANLEALYEETCELQFSTIHDLVIWRPAPQERFPARLVALMDVRAELYEQITPVRRNAMLWIHRSPVLGKRIGQLNQALRNQLEAVLAPQWEDLEGIAHEQRLDAAEASGSWEAWEFMRARKGFSRERVYRAMSAALGTIALGALHSEN